MLGNSCYAPVDSLYSTANTVANRGLVIVKVSWASVEYPSRGDIRFLPVKVDMAVSSVCGNSRKGISFPLIARFCVRSRIGVASSIRFFRLVTTPLG